MHRTEGYGNDNNMFTEGDPAAGVPATWVTASWANALQEEIAGIIEAAGLTLLTAATDTRNQLLAAIKLILALNPAYSKQMSGDETFTYSGGSDRKYFLDPNGADRNFNPSGSFPVGFEAVVVNNGGNYNIIFDSTGSAQVITSGQTGRCIWNGTNWI